MVKIDCLTMRRGVWQAYVGISVLMLYSYGATGQEPVTATIHVNAGHVLNTISPWLTGSCLEDVNHEIYGGLYDQKIFGESFEEPPPSAKFDGWKNYGGDWKPEGAGCRVASDAGAKLVRDAPDFADGTVQADVRFADNRGINAGLLVRVQEPGIGADSFSGYEVSLSPSAQTVILGKHRHDWHLLTTVPTTVEPGKWHHLRVGLQGPRIRIYVDGAPDPQIDYTDSDGPLLTGKTALRTWFSNVSFQNVRILNGRKPIENRFQATSGYVVSGLWDVIHTGNAPAEFQHENNHPFNGEYCQLIKRGEGAGAVGVANRGLNRWGISVAKGQIFEGHLYLRAEELKGPVTVALQSADGLKTYATHRIGGITGEWAKYPFTLTSNATDKTARFAFWIDTPGALRADQAVLMGTGRERFHGLPIRADIANALAAEGVTFLRYGGSMVNAPGYLWKNMIGDPDRRPPYKGWWYRYTTNGFGIGEFVQFCETAHIEPAFAINIEEDPKDVADMVDYLNGGAETAGGRRRAANGHPKPYGVRFIEIGNEEVIGGDDPAAYAHYAARFQTLYAAMHPRDPGLKFVIAAWWRPDSTHVESVFKALNGKASYWDLHVDADPVNAGENVDRQLAQMQSRFEQWGPGTALKAVIFEENGGLHNMQRALGHATVLNATRRHGEFVAIDCPANCLQPWMQNDNGWDQGQVFFTADHVWAMPPYYSQQMAAYSYLPLRVESALDGGNDLDVTATRSREGKTLVLHVVNFGGKTRPASITLAGFEGCKSLAHSTTLSGELQAVNPPEGSEINHSQASQVNNAGSEFKYNFPAYSYTVLRLTR